MAKKDEPNNVFGGFEAIAGEILNTPDQNEVPEIDPEELLAAEEAEETEEEEELTEDEKLEAAKLKEEEDDESDDDDDDDDEGDSSDEELTELGEYEASITKLFQQELYDELGWDIEEDENFDNVKDLVEYVKTAVAESSKPIYANEELQKLDSFVKQGGKIEDYIQKVPAGTIDLTDPDLTSESVQRDVLRELMSTVNGYSEDRIKRTLARYEDGGIMEEQAEDAVELLKEYKADSKQRLLDGQEKYDKGLKIQQQNFYSDVEESVKSLKDIRGIKISDREKQELLEYIFKPESDGRTKYQREYASNTQHLIESAFFTKDKDKNTLLTKAKQGARTDAYKELHQKIKASKGKRQKSSRGQSNGGVSDTLGNLGQSLIRKV